MSQSIMDPKDFSKGSLFKHFINFIGPAILGMVVISLYVMVDAIFIGQGVGQDGLAALGYAFPFLGIIFALTYTVAIGSVTLFSIFRGQKRELDASRMFNSAIIINSIISILILIIGELFVEPISRFLGAEGQVLPLTVEYIQYYIIFSIFIMLSGTLNTFIRNAGFPFLSIIALGVGSILNIILDFIMIFILHKGMMGAAVASGVCQLISTVILVLIILSGKTGLKFAFQLPHRNEWFRIFRSGLPTFFGEISIVGMILIFNQVLKHLAGDNGVTVFTILGNIGNILILTFLGIGQAIQPIAGYNFGAKKYSRVKKIYFLGILSSGLISLIIFTTAMAWPDKVAGLFLSHEEVSPITLFVEQINEKLNPDGQSLVSQDQNSSNVADKDTEIIIEMTIRSLQISGWAALFMGINFVSIAFFQAIEKSRLSTTIQILRGIVFTFGFGLLLPLKFNHEGVWMAFPAAEGLTFIISAFWIIKYFKQQSKEIAIEQEN